MKVATRPSTPAHAPISSRAAVPLLPQSTGCVGRAPCAAAHAPLPVRRCSTRRRARDRARRGEHVVAFEQPLIRVSPSAIAPRIRARCEQLLSPGIAASPRSGRAGRRDQLHPSSAATWAARSIAWARLRRGSQAVSQLLLQLVDRRRPAPANAFGDIQRAHFQMDAAGMHPLGPGDGEEGVDLGEDIGQAADLALAAMRVLPCIGSIAHTAAALGLRGGASRAAARRRCLRAPKRPISTSLPARLAGSSRSISRSSSSGLSVGPHFTPTTFSIPRRYSTWAPSSWRVRSPSHSMCPEVAHQRPALAAGQRLLIMEQQGLVAGEDRPPGLARRGEAGGSPDRLHVGADHPLRIGRARRGVERGAVDDVAAIGRQGDPAVGLVSALRGLANWPAIRATSITGPSRPARTDRAIASNRPAIPATCSATGSSKLSAQSPPWSRKPLPAASRPPHRAAARIVDRDHRRGAREARLDRAQCSGSA